MVGAHCHRFWHYWVVAQARARSTRVRHEPGHGEAAIHARVLFGLPGDTPHLPHIHLLLAHPHTCPRSFTALCEHYNLLEEDVSVCPSAFGVLHEYMGTRFFTCTVVFHAHYTH